MFYVKQVMESGIEIKVPVTEEDIVTNCYECQKEIQLDAERLISILDDGDLNSTKLMCDTCSHKNLGQEENKNSQEIQSSIDEAVYINLLILASRDRLEGTEESLKRAMGILKQSKSFEPANGGYEYLRDSVWETVINAKHNLIKSGLEVLYGTN
jgi:hypothetical protein